MRHPLHSFILAESQTTTFFGVVRGEPLAITAREISGVFSREKRTRNGVDVKIKKNQASFCSKLLGGKIFIPDLNVGENMQNSTSVLDFFFKAVASGST